MTELYVKCRKHGRTHVHVIEWNLSDDYVYGECGCTFLFNSGHIRNWTEEQENEKTQKYKDDHQGGRYQDGSREFEGIMLQDGSYI